MSKSIRFIAIIFVFAVFFRVWCTFDSNEVKFDEELYASSAKMAMSYGVGDWRSPPFGDFIFSSSIALFGDNSVGRRMPSVIFGSMNILMLYLVGRRLYTDKYVPLLAALLLAFDPFDIFYSRTAMLEQPAIFFFLSFVYFIMEFCESNRNTLTLSGLAIGLTISTKSYFLFAIIIMSGYALYTQHKRTQMPDKMVYIQLICNLVLLPIGIYLLFYLKWFGRGHTLSEFFQFRYDSYWIDNYSLKFVREDILILGGKPWEWFLKVLSTGKQMFSDGHSGQFSIQINNPLFRIMVYPAIGISAYYSISNKKYNELLATALFFSCYLLFFMVNRQINSYSSLVLLPFAYLILGHAVVLISNKFNSRKIIYFFIGMVFISGLYLFPIASELVIPIDYYKPVLSVTRFY